MSIFSRVPVYFRSSLRDLKKIVFVFNSGNELPVYSHSSLRDKKGMTTAFDAGILKNNKD